MWEGSLREIGYVYMYGWVPLRSTWNYHNIVDWLCVTQSCWLFVTPWTVAFQAPLSVKFSRQEYWSGLSFPTLEEYKIKSFKKVKSINFVKVNFHIESKRQKEDSTYELHLIEIFTMNSSNHFLISYPVYPLQLFSWCFSSFVCTMQHVLCKTIWVCM